MNQPQKKRDLRDNQKVAEIEAQLLSQLEAGGADRKNQVSSTFPIDFSASGNGKGGGGGTTAAIEP